MAKVWIYFFVLVWILYLMSAGIYLFSRGFLLSRRVQTQHSTCTRLRHCHESEVDLKCLHRIKVDEILNNVNTSSEYCLPKKTRVVLLVIDALKYEFGVYDKNKSDPLPYENKLAIFDELLTSQPNNSRLFKFIADAPTTTLQRLKGITTGSLPTFIDIGANFATPEINEDNLIDQVVESNLSAVFMGDNTWVELFPKRFMREYPFPSFNIFDLDTVDNGINAQLPGELSRNDWSLLIAHYLGVDHCGHTHGPLHLEMARKLTEMNAVIRMIVDQMDEETTLFVIGDHGMTVTGDHGGATNDEVTSLLFAYTKKYSFLTDSGDNVMDQIDLVPTMASILGIPIPYSNLGSVNFDLVPNVPIHEELPIDVVKMLHSWQNVIQMRYYFSNYTQQNRETFKADMLDDFFTNFYIFSLRVTTLYTNAAMENFSNDVKIYLQDIAAKCRLIWVRFDASQISQGLLFTVVVNIFTFLLIINLKFHQIEVVFSPTNLSIIYGSNACLAVLAFIFHERIGVESAVQCILITTSVYSILLFAFFIVQNWDYISLNWSQQKHFSHILSRLTLGFSLIVFYSNSFIIEEQKILCFLLGTALIMFLYNLRKQSVRNALRLKYRLGALLSLPYAKLSVIVVFGILLLRVTYSFHRCREEQGNCTEFVAQNIHGNDRKLPAWNGTDASALHLYPLVPVILFAILSQYFLRKCGNLSGFAPSVLLAAYGPTVAATACGAHFFMTSAKTSKLGADLSQVTIDAAAWIVFGIFAAQIVILLHRPLLLFVLRRTNQSSFNITPFSRVVPQIFMKMKRMYEDGNGSNGNLLNSEETIPIVYGLATVYSSVFLSTCSVFVYVLAVLLGPSASPGIFATLAIATAILLLNAVHRNQICTRLEQCLQIELLPLVAWSLLIHYSFYATSHQATLSQIDWHSAFVGRTASYDHNNVLSAVLVLLNTFGGAFITTFLYPLLVITPTSLYATFPSLAARRLGDGDARNASSDKREKTKKMLDNIEYQPICVTKNKRIETEQEYLDVGRGELTLYENDDVFIGSVFKVACQFVILQGMRIFSSMLACTIHCRHLMVWKIFAPRFIYEGITTYVMFIAILLAFLLVIRINTAVNRFMAKMSSHS